MPEFLFEQLEKIVVPLLQKNSLLLSDAWRHEVLAGDGSDRCFIRIVQQDGGPTYLAVLPNQNHPRGMAESLSSYKIGSHLYRCGVPVPQIFAFDEQTGTIVFEDLGDILFHKFIKDHSVQSETVLNYYEEAIKALVRLQVSGKNGFVADYCWDTVKYDEQLMLEKESNYFRQAFCEDFLGFHDLPDGLSEEFRQLAHRTAQEPAEYLLHRDFQSRNLMIHKNRIRVIDFQGARFGPLGYDLASLLIDPYARVPVEQQDTLLDYYLTTLEQQLSVDRSRFIEGYYYMAFQRNLQILGAFAFLSQKKGKVFFYEYIKPAASSLYAHLVKPAGNAFPLLQALSEKIIIHLEDNQSLSQK